MAHRKRILLFFIPAIISLSSVNAQEVISAKTDTIVPLKDTIPANDSVKKNVYSPKTAAIRSAILPGLGQAYNKKYWKIPIVYTALGITTYIFVDNIKTYREYRFAYAARIKAQPPLRDSTDYNTLKDLYKIISPESIRAARDEFRKYIDYSALFFLLFWGLNVVDAAVDAHLKSFDVGPDLSLKLKVGNSMLAGTAGVSLIINFK
jgi:hypothetical protein